MQDDLKKIAPLNAPSRQPDSKLAVTEQPATDRVSFSQVTAVELTSDLTPKENPQAKAAQVQETYEPASVNVQVQAQVTAQAQVTGQTSVPAQAQAQSDHGKLSAQSNLSEQSELIEQSKLSEQERLQLAGRIGQAVAEPIVAEGNEQALKAAQQAAIQVAHQGHDESLQQAAAVAAAAAAVGNAKINLDVVSDASLKANASSSEVESVTQELDKSLDKLDLETPQRSLLSITWPIFIDLALYFATLIINTVMVGMVSVKSVAELTIGNQIFDLALIIFNFFNIGVCVVSAQGLGANNKRLVRRIIHVGLGINIIMGTIVSIAIFSLSGYIVEIMQVPAEIAVSSHHYLQILSLSFLPLALCLVGSAILRAYNCTRDAMYVSLIVNLITVGGNSLFLFGWLGVPEMGVVGVAISTVIARTAAVFVFIPLVLIRTKVKIVPRFMFVFSRKVILSILNIGLPGAGENLSWHTQYMFMTGVVASLGAMELATQGIYFQIIQVLMIFSASIGMGTELLVAHYTGAMRLDLANKQLLRSVKIGEVATVILTFSMPLGTGAFLISCFTDSPEVLALATPLFLLTVFQEPGRILNVIIINSLRATGDTRFPVIMAVISMWGISVPLGTFLALHMGWGLLGVWIGFTADEWCRGIAMLLRWKSLAWQKAAKRIYEKTLKHESLRKQAIDEHQKKVANLSA